MKKQIVVTGGAGFIGANLVKSLNERGIDDIVIVDRLGEEEKWRNLRSLRYEDFIDIAEFLQMVLKSELWPIEAIFHMGACSATTEKDADYLLHNNYAYTRELCIWALENNVRFVYASSAATYGDGSFGYSDADENTLRLSPLNMYGYSKHMFDLWALKNDLLDSIAGIKFFNVYGPYEDHKGDMRSVVNKAFAQIMEQGKVQLFKSHIPEYKDGEQVRDFVFVKDAVDVALYFYDNPEVSGIYNCGTGKARTWVDLVTAVFKAMGREPDIEFIDMPVEIRDKYQYHTEADTAKLRASGYSAEFTSLEDGVYSYVNDYLTKL